MRKKRLHPGEVWWEALRDFHNARHEDLERAEKDQQRFQTGRLYAYLIKRIKAEATGRDEWINLFICYQFLTRAARRLGYDYGEVCRLHGEELKALGLLSARSFSSLLPRKFRQAPERFLYELRFRVLSIASWMEAQESFSMWLVFKKLPQAWRGNTDDRARTIQAIYLSQMHRGLLISAKHKGKERIGAHLRPGLGIGTNYKNQPWNNTAWKGILEQAARLTAKKYDCTELERWVWWCYPLFRRYRWNAREVLNAASEREIDFEKEKAGIDKLTTFQKYWIRRGLRFTGRKQKQSRTPMLAEFVRQIVLPDSEKMCGSLGGFLFLPKKN